MKDQMPVANIAKEALQVAATQFKSYADGHRAKAERARSMGHQKFPPVGDDVVAAEYDQKAETNLVMAKMCEIAFEKALDLQPPQEIEIRGSMVVLGYANMNEAVEAADEIKRLVAQCAEQQKDDE